MAALEIIVTKGHTGRVLTFTNITMPSQALWVAKCTIKVVTANIPFGIMSREENGILAKLEVWVVLVAMLLSNHLRSVPTAPHIPGATIMIKLGMMLTRLYPYGRNLDFIIICVLKYKYLNT